MSKRTATERMHKERRRQEARDRRVRAMIATGGVIAVVAVAGVVGTLMAGVGRSPEGGTSTRAPLGATGDDRVVLSVGKNDAPSTLDVYEDFRCPACGRFEARYHRVIDRLVKQGKVKANYHLASFIDANVGGNGSKDAANAAACAADEHAFPEYHNVLYAHQPPETQDAFGRKARLIALAKKVPELRGNRDFAKCVREGSYQGWVERSQKAFDRSGVTSTPTVLLNGKDVFPDGGKQLSPRALAASVEKAYRRSGAGAAERSARPKNPGVPSAAVSVSPRHPAAGAESGKE